jgi:hypothetical protein
VPAPQPDSQHVNINVNAPSYISPSISFDPETDVVFFTYRNAETGKVREQYPPDAVVQRYRAVDDSGAPTKPALPAPNPPTTASAPGTPAPTAPEPSPAALSGTTGSAATPPGSGTIA